MFDIVIKNNGVGKVYKKDVSCEDLDDAVKRADAENLVSVDILPSDIECNFIGSKGASGEVRLDEVSTTTLKCKKTVIDQDSNFEQKLTIKLSYKYVDSTGKDIKIYE